MIEAFLQLLNSLSSKDVNDREQIEIRILTQKDLETAVLQLCEHDEVLDVVSSAKHLQRYLTLSADD
jgi:hypothetical protein